jgi:DNA-binding NarL/FixJ family response regulator
VAHILRDVTQARKTEQALKRFLKDLGAADPDSQAVPKARPWGRKTAAPAPAFEKPAPALSAREVEVLKLLAEGTSTKGLAEKLNISHFTARNHIQNILGKLGLHSKAQAVSYAFRKGIL